MPDYKSLYKSPKLTEYVDAALVASEYVTKNSIHQLDDSGYRLCQINQRNVRPFLINLYDPNSISALPSVAALDNPSPEQRIALNRGVYSIQKSLELYLDAFGETQSNRKVGGHLFEGLIQAIAEIPDHIETKTGTIKVRKSKLSFDKIFVSKRDSEKKIVVASKTSTKDRASMMFTDRFMFNKIIGDSKAKFVSIILNDVQRTGSGVSSTFLPGHHDLYTDCFGPMDGHYYLDSPQVVKFPSLDRFIFDDLPNWI